MPPRRARVSFVDFPIGKTIERHRRGAREKPSPARSARIRPRAGSPRAATNIDPSAKGSAKIVCENRMKLRKRLIIFAPGWAHRTTPPNRRRPAGQQASKLVLGLVKVKSPSQRKVGIQRDACSAKEAASHSFFIQRFVAGNRAVVVEGLPSALLEQRRLPAGRQ